MTSRRGMLMTVVLGALLGAAPVLAGQATSTPSAKTASKPLTPKQIEEIKRAHDARLKEIQRKIEALHSQIDTVNGALKLRTAGPDVFDRKRTLENQLRDLITLLGMEDNARAEAQRLGQEAREMRRTAHNGPLDPRRLQLANFIEARQQEYLLFGTR